MAVKIPTGIETLELIMGARQGFLSIAALHVQLPIAGSRENCFRQHPPGPSKRI